MSHGHSHGGGAHGHSHGSGNGHQAADHLWEERSFHKPTWCGYCHKFIWGVRTQGKRCATCHMKVHNICAPSIKSECLQSKECCVSEFDITIPQDSSKNLPLGVKLFDWTISDYDIVVTDYGKAESRASTTIGVPKDHLDLFMRLFKPIKRIAGDEMKPGVVVQEIAPASLAEYGGVQAFDVIRGVNGMSVDGLTREEVLRHLEVRAGPRPFTISVIRSEHLGERHQALTAHLAEHGHAH